MKRALFLLVAVSLLALHCYAQTYRERWRPQYHFTPAKNFMNDPNGLVYYKGEYHLFYQHNPQGTRWGHMSWGHAVSQDMLRWKHLPLAIPERPEYMIYSGSAVIDWNNSSGLCKEKRGDRSCMIAIFTAASGDTWQRQHLAYSNDRGRTWTEYEGNPVADLKLPNFRDPKVFWYDPQKNWVMVAVVAEDRKVVVLDSKDLKKFVVRSEFTVRNEPKRQWECPDLFELPVEGSNERKWVMIVNINPGAPAGGTGTKYYIGDFDGERFKASSGVDSTLWADFGKDFYATQTFAEMPKGDTRRVWLGWISNWQYANDEPTTPWKGMQSIPRELKLRRYADGLRLVQIPVRELASLESEIVSASGTLSAINSKLRSAKVSRSARITGTLRPGAATQIGLRLLKSGGEETIVGFDAPEKTVYVDRTLSGEKGFSKDFAGVHSAPVENAKEVKLDIFIDQTSLEIFVNDGERVLSERVFPLQQEDFKLELFATGGKAGDQSVRITRMKSVWE